MTDFPAETARALESWLKGRVEGEVRFDAGSRALYAHDASNYRQVPIGVVIPKSQDDVIATIEACRRHGAPVLARGGGTSLAGQTVNVAVVMDFSKYLDAVLSLDPERRLARVEPGCNLDTLRHEAEKHHLTFGPDPATHDHNTLGGMVGNNSCGVHSVMAGRTVDNVRSLDIVTYEGLRLTVGRTSDEEYGEIVRAGGRRAEIYRRLRALAETYGDEIRARFPRIPRRVSGFSLDQLLPENGFDVARALVGSEGTCVTVLEAELELVPSPPVRVTLVLGYPDVYLAGDRAWAVRHLGAIALEGMDRRLADYMEKKGLHAEDLELLPEGDGWLLAEFGGATREEAEANARRAMDQLNAEGDPPSMRLYSDKGRQARVWKIRESGLGATANVPGEPLTWPGWEDAAVHPERLGQYLRDFRALLDRYGYGCSLYGHFGDGCIHVRIDFDLFGAEGVARYKAFTAEAADLVVSYGGSLSGEHGDGQSRADLLERQLGPRLIEAMREFKSIWDPQGNMNPGKVVDPYPRDSNLKFGPDFHPPRDENVLAFAADRGSFNRATWRCVGVGKCRRTHSEGDVMCPSYMATREEKHSTRGRARLLFEMIHGGVIEDHWRSDAVHDALDLCLACKGCKHDCPVDVDMAAYKAEFHHHYYKGRMRPREAWSMGMVQYWARLAEPVPALANFVNRAPLVSRVTKWVGDIAQQREMPRFRRSFRRDFRPLGQGRRVILFPDTFNDHFHPEALRAAAEVLARAGCRVEVPRARLCCGRPLYAWGWLDRARSGLSKVLDVLGDDIRAGTPIIGLEPACVATFKDELQELFPDDDRARRLGQQSFMIEDFLMELDGFRPPRLGASALVQTHCYRKAVLGQDGMKRLFDGMGMDVEICDSGCCGMAGSFGFEAKHYEVSQACAERALLPAVRARPAGTFILADGFSCREQIRQNTGRAVLHPAEILRLAMGDRK